LAGNHADAHRHSSVAGRNSSHFRSRNAHPANDCLVWRPCLFLQRNPSPTGPFPAIVERLRERAESLSGATFNAALANLYRNGRDSVGWHSDNEAGLGNCATIASLSLGGERRFQFRHRKTKQTITLGLRMGHWLIMAGDTQCFWVHQVPKSAAAVAPRVNLTFRHMILSRPS
jgi:alkylated DNA repair dioxygenase AlkB